MRITGPYPHRSGWRCGIVSEGRRTWSLTAGTPEAARRAAETEVEAGKKNGGLTVREAIEAFVPVLRESGIREISVTFHSMALHRFFRNHLGWSLSRITPTVAQDIYTDLRRQTGRNGPLSPDTHRAYLTEAKRLLRFCVEQGWVKTNAAEGIKPVGKKNRGKPQLTLDEQRALWSCCLAQAPKDHGAVAVLVALGMGLRAGEIVNRTVRSLDDGGRVLRLEAHETKNKKARAVRVPTPLQPLLRELARDKVGAALLWTNKQGVAYTTGWLRETVHKYCELAGVPLVCSHSLRGSHATTALTAGATPDLVASVLGHHDASVTRRHYFAEGAEDGQEQEARVLKFKEGDR